MAGAAKQAFIEAVRTTPEGISGFLTTAIPAAPGIPTPADVDAAIIANGICAKYICDFFAAFNGLTPIELLLRIGQHNNVLESAMIAGLEYIEGSDSDEDDIKILSPVAEQTYPAGDIAFSAEAANGECSGIYVSVGPHQSKQLAGGDLMLALGAEGTYTAVFTGVFEDGPVTQSVTFYVTEDGAPPPEPEPPPDPPPDPPDPPDKDKLKQAREKAWEAYRKLIRTIEEASIDNFDSNLDIVTALNAYKQAIDSFNSVADTSISTDTLTLPKTKDELRSNSSTIMDAVNAAYTQARG